MKRSRSNGKDPARPKTVCIVGSHTATRLFAPWQDTWKDFWVFNESASIGWPQKVDAVFQMHAEPVWKNPLNRNDRNYPEWMKQEHPFPVYMLDEYEGVPASKKFPLDAISRRFLGKMWKGESNKHYYTSSVAFALALAIHKGYRRIEIYGIEMESETEYNLQRDGVFFWIGLALGKGIEVYIHPNSNLFKEPLYGYEGGAYLGREQLQVRYDLLTTRKAEAEAELDEANRSYASTLEKAMDESGGEPGLAAVATAQQYFAGIKRQAEAVMAVGMFIGALHEVERYLKKCDEMDKQSGFHMLARQEFELTAAQAAKEAKQHEANVNVMGATARSAWKALEGAVKAEHGLAQLDELSEKYSEAHQAYIKAVFDYGRLDGVVKENVSLLDMVDVLLRAAGGDKAEEALLMAKMEEAEVVNA